MRRYALVEGHGEVEAVGNLLARVSRDLGDQLHWSAPLRWKNLHQWENPRGGGVRRGVEHVRGRPDAASLLILRDADDGCPAQLAPTMGAHLRALGAPFPIAYVLFKPEYEVLFLPCLPTMAGRELDGRPGLVADTCWDAPSWEGRRGLKEWLSTHFPRGRAYKPTVDQLSLTRMIDLRVVAEAGVPCFGTLQRSLAFLRDTTGRGGAYPP
jgi:hypothetical protein